MQVLSHTYVIKMGIQISNIWEKYLTAIYFLVKKSHTMPPVSTYLIYALIRGDIPSI